MRAAAFLASTLAAAPLAAQAVDLELPIERVELDNGLDVLLVPDHASPTVAIAVYYDVGSRNEEQGRSGFAHLFEHMMFQGSANVGKGEHFILISRNGGEMNGTTSEDRTNYFEILPSDRLELGLFLEADRMRSLAITEENFENQREVVKEERRLRIDNQPYGPSWLRFYELAYDDSPYGHSVIGSMEDLDAAELSDVQAFFDLYYAPNNAILVIAGDFDRDAALALVEQEFGDIPRGNEPPPVVITEEIPRSVARGETMTDALATQPALMLGWMIPGWPAEEIATAELLARILAGGESSRLHRRLVQQDGVALDVSAWVEGRRGPDMLALWATGNDAPPATLDAAIREEIERLRTYGFTDEELESARRQWLVAFIGRSEGNLGRALVIGQYALFRGDAQAANAAIDEINAVTRADVEALLETWITNENSVALGIDIAQPADETAAGVSR